VDQRGHRNEKPTAAAAARVAPPSHNPMQVHTTDAADEGAVTWHVQPGRIRSNEYTHSRSGGAGAGRQHEPLLLLLPAALTISHTHSRHL
jgi:hypothetical protein